ncbi:MAG: hypothetical protein ISP90_18415 [Nevskia sp.]|nr:hypothetical protein [Nevskia sp.]
MPRFTTLLLILCCAPALAEPAPATLAALAQCAARSYDDYAAGMAAWEKDWAHSVAQARPELGEAAQLRADAQTLALKRDGLRIRYLAGQQPGALDLEETVAALRLFDWAPASEQALRHGQPDYAGLADQTEQAQRQAETQPRRDELEAYFEESFTGGSGAAVARQLNQILEQGNAALDACRREHPLPQQAPPAG